MLGILRFFVLLSSSLIETSPLSKVGTRSTPRAFVVFTIPSKQVISGSARLEVVILRPLQTLLQRAVKSPDVFGLVAFLVFDQTVGPLDMNVFKTAFKALEPLRPLSIRIYFSSHGGRLSTAMELA